MGLETIMYQTQFEFFWPLTEQISLDLDFSNSDTRKPIYSVYETGSLYVGSGNGIATTSVIMDISPTKLTVDVEQVVFKQKVTPPWYRKIIYKIIGINWELK